MSWPGRRHSLDRHRQEECHHDDRFRAHGGARWDVAEASHHPGLHPAVQAHHRDHALRAIGRSTSGTRHGVGSELRRPLGIAIVGGLCVSQLLTLYTTPVVYLYMERIAGFMAKVRTKAFELKAAIQPLPSE
jgi:hypothetical protein